MACLSLSLPVRAQSLPDPGDILWPTVCDADDEEQMDLQAQSGSAAPAMLGRRFYGDDAACALRRSGTPDLGDPDDNDDARTQESNRHAPPVGRQMLCVARPFRSAATLSNCNFRHSRPSGD